MKTEKQNNIDKKWPFPIPNQANEVMKFRVREMENILTPERLKALNEHSHNGRLGDDDE